MPRPTAWPLVLAVGLLLLAAGLVTSLVFSALGAGLAIAGAWGWLGQLPAEAGTMIVPLVPPEQRAPPAGPAPEPVATLRPGMAGHRTRVPEMVHPYSAGLKGGVVGGCMMAAVALLYGLVSGRGVWYPVNLLAAMVMPSYARATLPELEQFRGVALVMGVAIHALASLGLGFCLAVLMPMLPSRQFLVGSLVAPLLWSGAIYGFMGILNPVMNRRVDWPWFIASQFAYGLPAALVITRSESIYVGRSPPGPPGPTADGSEAEPPAGNADRGRT